MFVRWLVVNIFKHTYAIYIVKKTYTAFLFFSNDQPVRKIEMNSFHSSLRNTGNLCIGFRSSKYQDIVSIINIIKTNLSTILLRDNNLS